MQIDWWALALLFYVLIGLGFTIQGIVKLAPLVRRGWERLREGHEQAEAHGDGDGRKRWRRQPAPQH